MADEESLSSFRARLLGAAVSTYVIITLLVPLKFWCRVRSGGWRNLGMDDFITVFGLLVAHAFNLICLIGMWPALGIHIAELMGRPDGVELITRFLKMVFIGQLLYTFGVAVSKFAILAFYWRLFSITARIPIYIMSFIVFGWLTGICFAVIFACDPIPASWDITITEKTCISTKSIYLGGSVPNVITDVILILMPLPYVYRLQAPITQRLLLSGLFMLGIFIAIVSCVRLVIFMHIPLDEGDITYHFREIIVWSCVEVNVGLACACLPSLKPALSLLGLNRIFGFTDSRNLYPSSSGRSENIYNKSSGTGGTDSGLPKKPRKKGATGGLFSTIAGITRMEDDEEDGFHLTNNDAHGRTTAEVRHGSVATSQDTSDNGSHDGRPPMPNSIKVSKDWSVKMERQGL